MKKRDQWPDSYTYMHLLRGLCEYWQHSTMLSKALSIYHSMSSENSRVEPRTIHTNMALKFCARAGDMDALWGVASKLPEKGSKSADSITYSIILNAIRRAALEDMDTNESDEKALVHHFDKAVLLGCRVWSDINAKWRRGNLVMDDALVCAMGRLLLLSYRPKAWDAILSLVETTEEVPRRSPIVEDDFLRQLPILKPQLLDAPHSAIQEASQLVAKSPNKADEVTPLDQFRTLITFVPNSGSSYGRADMSAICTKPTNNTLSLLIETCQKLRNKQAADSYWTKLTQEPMYRIKPDSDNFHAYLRLLRQSHSSTRVAQLLSVEMKPSDFQQKTFRIAMSACVKDTANPSVMGNCTKLVDLMVKHLDRPHIPTLMAYLQFAKSSKKVPTIIQAVKHIDAIIHLSKVKILPHSEKFLALPPAQKKEIIDFTQCLRDCVAWAERDKDIAQWRDSHWEELHGRVMRTSTSFLMSKVDVTGRVDRNEQPRTGPRGTARVNARSVRRMSSDQEVDAYDDSGLAELPFEVDSFREARM